MFKIIILITKRLKEYIKHKKLTTSSVESMIGASNGMLRRAFSSGTDIKSQWLESVLENFHDLNPFWLLSGKGDMLLSDDRKPNQQEKVVKKNDHKNDHINRTKPNQQEKVVIYKQKDENNNHTSEYLENYNPSQEEMDGLAYKGILDPLSPDGIALYIMLNNERFKDNEVFQLMLKNQGHLASIDKIDQLDKELDEFRKEIKLLKSLKSTN